MKKIFYLAAIAAFALVSCQEKNAPVIEEKTDAFAIKASIEQPETNGNAGVSSSASSDIARATINGSNQLVWATGDKIGIYFESWDDNKYQPFTLSTGEGTTEGTFTMDAGWAYNPADMTVAYFPYRAGTNMYSGNLYFELPAEYWSYDNEDLLTPLVASASSSSISAGNISFKHVGAAVKLTINNLVTGTYKAKMSVTGKQITGYFHINPTNAGTDAMALNDAEDASKNHITLNTWKENGAFSWIFPVPALTTPKLTFEIIDNNGVTVWSKSPKAQASIGRADLLVMPALTITPYQNFTQNDEYRFYGKINGSDWTTLPMMTDGNYCILSGFTFVDGDAFKIMKKDGTLENPDGYGNNWNFNSGNAGAKDIIYNISANTISVVDYKFPYPTITPSSISITDDSFEDWSFVPGVTSGTTTLKVASDATNLYFYIQRTSTPTTVWGNGGYVWVTLDLDNDPSTGSATAWEQKYEFADYIYPYGGSADVPAFNTSPVGQSAGVNCSLRGELSGTTATYEFLIPRAELPTIPSTSITVKVMGNEDMSTVSLSRKL